MKRFLIASVAGFLCASAVMADDPTPASSTPPAATPGIVVGGTPGIPSAGYSTPSSTRRGLFGRLRNRGSSGTVTSAPSYSGGTIMTTPGNVVPSTPGTVVPTPMPPITKPGASATPAVTGNPVVLANGTVVNGSVVPAGGIMTASGVVIPASGSMMMMADGSMMPMASSNMTASTGSQRMGLIARMRARR